MQYNITGTTKTVYRIVREYLDLVVTYPIFTATADTFSQGRLQLSMIFLVLGKELVFLTGYIKMFTINVVDTYDSGAPNGLFR